MLNWKNNKSKINLIIDAILLIVLMSITGLGLMIKYVLLPGYMRNEIDGNGIELYFMGLTRHQWGTIHLYLGILFLFLLVLHIILHWGMICSIFRQIIARKTARIIISIFIGIFSISLALSPFLVNPEVAPLPRKYMHNRIPARIINTESLQNTIQNNNESISSMPVNKEVEEANIHHNQYEEIDINGTKTLYEISRKYNISVEELARSINIPVIYSNERLGRLKRRYGFSLDDLKLYVKTKFDANDR